MPAIIPARRRMPRRRKPLSRRSTGPRSSPVATRAGALHPRPTSVRKAAPPCSDQSPICLSLFRADDHVDAWGNANQPIVVLAPPATSGSVPDVEAERNARPRAAWRWRRWTYWKEAPSPTGAAPSALSTEPQSREVGRPRSRSRARLRAGARPAGRPVRARPAVHQRRSGPATTTGARRSSLC